MQNTIVQVWNIQKMKNYIIMFMKGETKGKKLYKIIYPKIFQKTKQGKK